MPTLEATLATKWWVPGLDVRCLKNRISNENVMDASYAQRLNTTGHMFESYTKYFHQLVESGDTYLFLLPVYVLLIGGERIAYLWSSHRQWNRLDATTNIFITLVQLGLNVVVGHLVPLAVMAMIFVHLSLYELNFGVWGWAFAFILYDLACYIDHRIAHRVGFFWSMHHVHHSSVEYNMTVASRGFILDITLLSRPTFYLLPYSGSPLTTSWWWSSCRISGASHSIPAWSPSYGDSMHSSLPPPTIESITAVPEIYRPQLRRSPHHLGPPIRHLSEEDEEPHYGVVTPIETYHPVKIELAGVRWLIHRCIRPLNWMDKVRCLYMPPEWAPPGGIHSASSAVSKRPKIKALNRA